MAPKRKRRKMVEKLIPGRPYTTFEDAFPNVKSLRFEYTIHPDVATTSGPYIMTEENFEPVIRCTNIACHEGGFQVAKELLRYVFSSKLERHEDEIFCSGHEPVGQHTRHCAAMLKCTVDVEYKT